MITFLCIQLYFTVHHFQCFLATGFHTYTTGDTVVFFVCDVHTTFDSHIIFFGFQTVILTSGNTEFELMRKFPPEISGIQFFCQCVGVDTSAGTDF